MFLEVDQREEKELKVAHTSVPLGAATQMKMDAEFVKLDTKKFVDTKEYIIMSYLLKNS